MSYDLHLWDPDTEAPAVSFNVTFNYAHHFRKVLGNAGIRAIYKMTGRESFPVLLGAIGRLHTNVTKDYFEATEGNARRALEELLAASLKHPNCIWDGD